MITASRKCFTVLLLIVLTASTLGNDLSFQLLPLDPFRSIILKLKINLKKGFLNNNFLSLVGDSFAG